MVGDLIYRKCIEDNSVFKKGGIYLMLEDFTGENSDMYQYLSDDKTIVSADEDYFEEYKEVMSIQEVICIYTDNTLGLTLREVYSVYKMETNSNKYYGGHVYKIIDDTYNEAYYSTDYFIYESEYDSLFDDEAYIRKMNRNISLKIKTAKLQEYESFEQSNSLNGVGLRELDIIRKEMQLMQIEELRNKENLEKERFIIHTIGLVSKKPNIAFNNTCNNKSSNNVYGDSGARTESKKGLKKSIFPFSKKSAETNRDIDSNNEDRNDISNIMYLERLNSLPKGMLGNIKIIENNLIILKAMDVADDILKLIYESIGLSTVLADYNSDDDTLVKLEEFLSNTIEYCYMLKNNKNIENNYVKGRLAGNINNAIDRNSEVFKKMIQDGDILQKHLK